MSRFKRLVFSLMASLQLIVPIAVPVSVYAAAGDNDIVGGLCDGVEFENVSDCGEESLDGGSSSLLSLVRKVVDIITLIVGFVAVIMIVYGGFKYITSGGDSGNVTGAKNTILYAVVGLIIVALAQVIVRFVLNTTRETVEAGLVGWIA